jgi:hypothetical protein
MMNRKERKRTFFCIENEDKELGCFSEAGSYSMKKNWENVKKSPLFSADYVKI